MLADSPELPTVDVFDQGAEVDLEGSVLTKMCRELLAACKPKKLLLGKNLSYFRLWLGTRAVFSPCLAGGSSCLISTFLGKSIEFQQ